jgi:hypothetical protein
MYWEKIVDGFFLGIGFVYGSIAGTIILIAALLVLGLIGLVIAGGLSRKSYKWTEKEGVK